VSRFHCQLTLDHTTDLDRGGSEFNPPPQFKLDIKNAPIQEEEGDVNAALADMANTLRAVRRLIQTTLYQC
jgi:hypothetical protein